MAQNLNQATQRSQYRDNLKALESLGTDATAFEDPATILESAAGAFILKTHQSITDSGMSVTGKSADMRINVISDTSLEVTAPAVLFFIDKGVNPSGLKLYETPYNYSRFAPPIAPLLEWIKNRQIQSVNNEQFGSTVHFKELTEEQQQLSTAYAMRYTIFKVTGIKPKNVMSIHIPSFIKDVTDMVTLYAASTLLPKLKFTSPETATRGLTQHNTLYSENKNLQ
jgi:hypothetical protein